MTEEEILKQLKHYTKLWKQHGYVGEAIKDSLNNLFFYKDWKIAGLRNKTTRHRHWLIKTGGKCVRCGSTKDLTQDHIFPRSKGGSNGLSNKQLLCYSCNRKKGDTI